jgi:hypothetical protein
MASTRPRDVFINCPFDDGYQPVFRALTFAIIRSGFRPRCALEVDDATRNRLSVIMDIIEECRYGIHDISRTDPDGDPPLPRFNMPLELDTDRYRFQRFLSDIAGQDIHAHNGEPGRCIEEVVTWLRTQSRVRSVPGGRAVVLEFAAFEAALPDLCAVWKIEVDELTFGDFATLVSEYIAANL